MTQTTWETIAAGKQAARAALIPLEWHIDVPQDLKNVTGVPAACGLLSAAELRITETSAPDLVASMVSGELTSESVTTAFAKRAAIAHQLTNCLTEIFFEDGIEAARAIDAEFARTGTPIGPLHGLPVSLKDNVNIKGLDATIGFIAYANAPVEEDADIVEVLRAAGAVLYCKTNVPTGMLMSETYNNVWGYTPNPYNTDYGSGGSSGGEAALLALRGSPLGVGTDIGGSIRMPAAICGLYGLKAAGGRFSSLGFRAGLPGQEAIKSVQGPMANDLSSLELYARTMLASKPWLRDPAVYPVPWREVEIPDKLAFGIIFDDGIVRPTPAVTRVLRETKAALEAAGHIVIEYTPYDAKAGNDLLLRLLLGDGGGKMHAIVRGGDHPEPWPLQLELFEQVYARYKDRPPTVAALWDAQAERQAYLRKLLKSWTDSAEVTGTGRPFDAIIAPVVAFPAAPRYTFRHAVYTGLWNLADATAVAFPAGHALATDVKPVEEFVSRNDDEREVWDKYNPAEVDGMPVGLQLITPRHHEELALKLTGVTVSALEASRGLSQSRK